MHPYFFDLDENEVPAFGEEYIGLPVDQIPSSLIEIFSAAASIIDSDSEELASVEEKDSAEKKVHFCLQPHFGFL